MCFLSCAVGDRTHLVETDGRSVHGVHNETFQLADDATSTGIRVLNGKFYELTDTGNLDDEAGNVRRGRRDFNEVQDALNAAAKELDVKIKIQLDDVFNFLCNV
ncbi:MAG: hypothetical protein ACOX69_09870 [Coriobacteriales bacterium]